MKSRFAKQVSLEDFTLLTLLSVLGLVWPRILYIDSFVRSSCIEQIGSYGLITRGILKGQTTWSMLFWTTLLALTYAVLLIVTETLRGRRRVIIAFCFLMMIGLALMAKAYWIMCRSTPF